MADPLWIGAGKVEAGRVPRGRCRIARDDSRKLLAATDLPVRLEPSPPRRVLLADDEVPVRPAFEALLRMKGCQVAAARDGRGPIRGIRRKGLDLIFLDVLLSSVGGAGVLEAVKERPPRRRSSSSPASHSTTSPWSPWSTARPCSSQGRSSSRTSKRFSRSCSRSKKPPERGGGERFPCSPSAATLTASGAETKRIRSQALFGPQESSHRQGRSGV